MLLIALCNPSRAQEEYSFQRLDVKTGLASNFVKDIVQDKDGFIWIATNNGLQRYDMYDFLTVPQLATMACTNILIDNTGRFWVATREGLMLAQNRELNFEKVPVSVDGTDARVFWETTLSQDVDNRIWMVTRLADDTTRQWHVMVFDETLKSFQPCRSVFTGLTDVVINIYADDPNYLWFMTLGGIVAYNRKTQVYSSSKNNRENIGLLEAGHVPYRFAMDHNQKKMYTTWPLGGWPTLFLAGSDNGPIEKQFPIFDTHEFLVDKLNNVWISGEGLARVSNDVGGYDLIKLPEEIRNINSICLDRDGNIWLGTSHGILIFDPQQQVLSRPNVDYNGNVSKAETMSLLNTSDSVLIVGTWQGGIFFYDQDLNPVKRFRGLATKDFPETKNAPPWSLFEDSKRNVWIGGQLGYLVRISKDGVKTRMQSPHLPRETIRSIAEDSFGNIWFGMHVGSLARYEPATGVFTTVIKSKSNYRSVSTLRRDGRFIWATAGIYLLKIDAASMQIDDRFSFEYKKQDVVTRDIFHGIFHVSENELLIASVGGIVRFDKRANAFSLDHFQGGVAGAYFVAPGHYVVAAEGEIIEYKDGRSNYLDKSGVLSSMNACENTPRQGILFGNETGFSIVKTRRERNQVLHVPKISSIRLMGKPLNVDSTLERGLVLRHDQSPLTINFSALTFFEKANVRYFLRTAEQVVDLGSEHSITYQQASAGDYQIEIKYNVADGELSPPVQLKVQILPPFWKTTWFLAIVLLLGILIPFGLYRIKIYRYKDLEKIRQKISRDLHDDMGSNLSTINILSSVARGSVGTQPQAKVTEALEKINDLSHQVLESVDDIVWSVDPRHNAFEDVVRRMRMLGGQLLESQDINFKFAVDGKLEHVQLNIERRNDFYLIYKETITNIARHARCRNVNVKLFLKKREVYLTIEDDGIGFDISNTNGGGHGIDNIKARAKNLKADLVINSSERKGTTTTLKFNM